MLFKLDAKCTFNLDYSCTYFGILIISPFGNFIRRGAQISIIKVHSISYHFTNGR